MIPVLVLIVLWIVAAGLVLVLLQANERDDR